MTTSSKRPFIWSSPSSSFSYEIAKGELEGHSIWNKFGYNLDLDSGGEEIIASWGGLFDPKWSRVTNTRYDIGDFYFDAANGNYIEINPRLPLVQEEEKLFILQRQPIQITHKFQSGFQEH